MRKAVPSSRGTGLPRWRSSQIRARDHLDPVAGRVVQVDPAPAVLGVGFSRPFPLRIRPMLNALGTYVGVRAVEQAIVDQERVVLHLDFHWRFGELQQDSVVEQ